MHPFWWKEKFCLFFFQSTRYTSDDGKQKSAHFFSYLMNFWNGIFKSLEAIIDLWKIVMIILENEKINVIAFGKRLRLVAYIIIKISLFNRKKKSIDSWWPGLKGLIHKNGSSSSDEQMSGEKFSD